MELTILGMNGPFPAPGSATSGYLLTAGKARIALDMGSGVLSLDRTQFTVEGQIHGDPVTLAVSVTGIPTLPFKPGKYLELQQGSDIYRCVLADGRLVMKFINMVKIFHELTPVPGQKR